MQARIGNPATSVPGALSALREFSTAAKSSVPQRTIDLVLLRASQINGCSVCAQMHAAELKKGGETDDRLATLAAWRDTPYFTDAERAALALAEAGTRLSDRPDPVPDEVWDEAARHYGEAELTALVIAVAAINTWNRLNVMTRQIPGAWSRD